MLDNLSELFSHIAAG